MSRSIAQALQAEIEKHNRYTIACPFNVSQIARGSAWCATMPDRSILFCNYETKEMNTYQLNNEQSAWDFMTDVLDSKAA
jgi:hypothetical protein